MKHSTSITAFAAAFAAAQEEMTGAKKGSTNPHFRSKYADLPAVMQATVPALNKHGISVLQFPSFDLETKLVSVETRLLHKSGEWVAGSCSALPRDHKNVQAVGSTITYLKRYGLQSMTGCPSEDDDGNAASPPPRQQRQSRQQPRQPRRAPRKQPPALDIPSTPPASKPKFTRPELIGAVSQLGLGLTDVNNYLVDNGKPTAEKMTSQQQSDLIDWLGGKDRNGQPIADKIKSHVRPTDG
jgi:hypothetical protein